MEKAIFIYNPLSGHRSVPQKLDYIMESFMERNILIQPYRMCNDKEERLLSVLKGDNYSYVIISGGDGTVSSVINTMLKNNINIPVGLIPSGTCNDLARSLGIPSELKKCVDIILNGNKTRIDVGLINGDKYFLNTCAGGIFVNVSFNTSSELKKKIGPLAYYIKAISEFQNIKPLKLKIKTDSKTIEDEFFLFVILNGKHAGGLSNIIEDAEISDGLMDILLIKSCPHIELVGLFFRVLANEFKNDKYLMRLRTKTCTIEGTGDVELSIDGEKGNGLPVSIEFFNQAVEVFVR